MISEAAFSLLEMITTMGMLSVIMSIVITFFFDTTFRSNDQELMLQAHQGARAMMDELAFELRMAGNGMPLGQPAFSISDRKIGEAALAILPGSDASTVVFRANLTGRIHLISKDFNPADSLTAELVSAEGLGAGTEIYINDLPVRGLSGLKGRIASAGTNSVTLSDSYIASENAVFAAGSILEPVSEIEFVSLPDWAGIRRISENTDEILLPNSQFSVEYLESDGSRLNPPLSSEVLAGQLSAVHLTVRVRTRRKLHASGSEFVAELQRTIALRNINLNNF